MFATWFIALIVSGGLALWVYEKMLHNNGNQRDTTIAALFVWFLIFIVLFLILRSLNI